MAEEMTLFRVHVVAALGPRVRVLRDAEGWPLAPGRYGRIEWRGVEWASSEHRLYAYTNRPRIIAKLRAVPRVHPAQIGDDEAAFWIAAEDGPTLRAVAGLIQTRTRRAPETGRSAAALALMRATSGRQDETGPGSVPKQTAAS